MKTKRIKAEKCNRCKDWGYVYVGHESSFRSSENCYLIRQSDVRALAEQLIDDIAKKVGVPAVKYAEDDRREDVDVMIHCLKRAGMTPGKEQGTK